jgi:hypothetical protein
LRTHEPASCAPALDERFGLQGLVGNSPEMQRVFDD